MISKVSVLDNGEWRTEDHLVAVAWGTLGDAASYEDAITAAGFDWYPADHFGKYESDLELTIRNRGSKANHPYTTWFCIFGTGIDEQNFYATTPRDCIAVLNMLTTMLKAAIEMRELWRTEQEVELKAEAERKRWRQVTV